MKGDDMLCLADYGQPLLAMLLALGETGSIFEMVTYAGAVMAAGFAPHQQGEH